MYISMRKRNLPPSVFQQHRSKATFTKKCIRRRPPHNALRSRERWYLGGLVLPLLHCMYITMRTRQIKTHFIFNRMELGPCLWPVFAVLQQLRSLFYTTRVALHAKNPVVCRGKNVDDRRVKICVRKLAINYGVCASPGCLVLFIVTRDEGLKIG
jgi:hypothetical protein